VAKVLITAQRDETAVGIAVFGAGIGVVAAIP